MNELKNWLPYKLVQEEGLLRFYWFNTYGAPFIEPFFEETISICRTKEQRNLLHPAVSDCRIMLDWAAAYDDIKPSAIIFHISRCGSTLISQMLAASDDHIVLAEVPVFDDILRLPFKVPGIDEAESSGLYNAALKYHASSVLSNETDRKKAKHVFIKTDSWHLCFYNQLRALFPSVPFILMYRTPDEVFRSHRKQPGMQAVNGLIEPRIFGIKGGENAEMSADVYLARVLENYLSSTIKIIANDQLCLPVNYNEGAREILAKISSFVNLNIPEAELKKMHQRSLFHSKKPNERFHEVEIKNIPSCLVHAMELYRHLENKRAPC
jgi:hypothetical protein